MHVEIDEWKSMQVTKIKAGINMKYISYHRDIKIYIDLTISVFFSFRNHVQGDGIGCGQLISFVPESKNSSWLAPREKYSLLLKSCTLWQFTKKQIIKGQYTFLIFFWSQLICMTSKIFLWSQEVSYYWDIYEPRASINSNFKCHFNVKVYM